MCYGVVSGTSGAGTVSNTITLPITYTKNAACALTVVGAGDIPDIDATVTSKIQYNVTDIGGKSANPGIHYFTIGVC